MTQQYRINSMCEQTIIRARRTGHEVFMKAKEVNGTAVVTGIRSAVEEVCSFRQNDSTEYKHQL